MIYLFKINKNTQKMALNFLFPNTFSRLKASPIVLVLLAINISVYLTQILNGIDWLSPDLNALILWGANAAPFTLQGQPWRLLTNIFLHGGFNHLFLNMLMLMVCGPVVERKFGRINFVVIYVVSGLLASLTSALWYAQHQVLQPNLDLFGLGFAPQLQTVVSVGASGALMGMTGAYFAAWLVETNITHTKADSISYFKSFALIIAVNLGMGFLTRGVDNACHVGGLLAGLMLGAVLAFVPKGARFTQQLMMHIVIIVSSVACINAGLKLNKTPELAFLKNQALIELAAYKDEQATIKANQLIAAEIAADAKSAPTPVDAKTAAGEQIDLSMHLSKNPMVKDLTLSPDGKLIYVLAGELDNAILVINAQTKRVINNIKGPKVDFSDGNCMTMMCEGKGADSLLISPNGQFAYVSSMQQNAVTMIDLKQNTITANIATGTFPRAMALSHNGQRLFVTNGVDNTISVIDLTTNSVTGSPIKLAGGTAENLPFGHTDGLWLTNDDAQLWALDAVLNQIQVIDTSNFKTLKIIALSQNFLRDAKMGKDGFFWVVGKDGIDAINIKTHTYEKNRPFCRSASYYDIATNPMNNTVAIAEDNGDYAASYVHLVKTFTNKTIGRYPIVGPQTPVFSKDGKQLYVLSKQPNAQGNAKHGLIILTLTHTLNVNQAQDESELLCAASY